MMRRKKSSGAGYIIPLLMLLIGNEAISLFALTWIVGSFLFGLLKEAERREI